MMSDMDLLTVATAVGCGVVGGVFFAFSTFVMPGLSRVRDSVGIAAMQAVNVAAVRPLFMTALFGTALLCMVLLVEAAASWSGKGSALLLTGSGLYLVGTVAVTIVRNVPLNDMLASLDTGSSDSAEAWRRYLREWTTWNHVRTVTAIAAAVLIVLAQ